MCVSVPSLVLPLTIDIFVWYSLEPELCDSVKNRAQS